MRASQSPLHLEIEAFIWAMECMKNLRQFNVTFATDCSQLVKMISKLEELSAFASYLKAMFETTLDVTRARGWIGPSAESINRRLYGD